MTTSKGERTTTINIRGSRRSRIESPLCRRRHQRYFTTSMILIIVYLAEYAP